VEQRHGVWPFFSAGSIKVNHLCMLSASRVDSGDHAGSMSMTGRLNQDLSIQPAKHDFLAELRIFTRKIKSSLRQNLMISPSKIDHSQQQAYWPNGCLRQG
jgi:hypothetical protein